MKKATKITGIIILIIGIILIIFGVGSLKSHNQDNSKKPDSNPSSPTPTPSDNPVTVLGRKYNCETKDETIINETNNIKYTGKATYSFVVMNDNSIFSDGYTAMMKFATVEDMNNHYNYLINDTQTVNPNNSSISKDENTLTITFTNLMVIGGDKTFNKEYLDKLKNIGYTCEEEK